jgi:beta-lactamase superfamily II metal-dependent hydrolase
MGCNYRAITHATGDNYVSIMMLLVFIPRVQNGSMHVSLFAGGDAHMETENQVVDFLQQHTVEVVKAGHHGARTSTSAMLLKRLQPNKFIISAGHEYGHPSKSSGTPPIRCMTT